VQLTLTMHPAAGGTPMRLSGPVLSILRKNPDGNWVIFRDANMVAPDETLK
jgi:ketosteroid isomerase-like protein